MLLAREPAVEVGGGLPRLDLALLGEELVALLEGLPLVIAGLLDDFDVLLPLGQLALRHNCHLQQLVEIAPAVLGLLPRQLLLQRLVLLLQLLDRALLVVIDARAERLLALRDQPREILLQLRHLLQRALHMLVRLSGLVGCLARLTLKLLDGPFKGLLLVPLLTHLRVCLLKLGMRLLHLGLLRRQLGFLSRVLFRRRRRAAGRIFESGLVVLQLMTQLIEVFGRRVVVGLGREVHLLRLEIAQ
mmetsp:Transcript_32053/g.54783  ORF Transcript_32053/g.54783 Transcript_32053/m.54783 type:complete len:245 (-) Transcript_32053:2296-3030(-)